MSTNTNATVVRVYTDGSCHTGLRAGAWACVLLFGDEKIILKGTVDDTTNNQMEIVAVIQAINYIKGLPFDIERIEIYSDSQYVIGIPDRAAKLKNANFHTKKGADIQNSDLVQTLLKLLEVYPVTFMKVASHQKATTAHDYNREVDMIARALVRSHVKNKALE